MRKLLIFLCLGCCVAGLLGVAAPRGTVKNRIVKVGFFKFDGYHVQERFDRRSGYGYDYLQNMLIYVDWQYEYVGYESSWSEMTEMLENGTIDLLSSARKTPERLEKFAFSDAPIGSSATILTVRAGNQKFVVGDYENWRNMRVGMLHDNSRNSSFAEFAKAQGFTFTPVFFSDLHTMIAELKSDADTIDAIVTSNLRAIAGEWVLATFDPSPFYIMVRKNEPELLAEVNFAISQLHTYDPGLGALLRERYYTNYSGRALPLTAAEREFIARSRAEGKTFKALLNPDRRPFSYFENGRPRGILGELAGELIRRTGLNIVIVPTATRADYQRAVDASDAVLLLDARHNFAAVEKKGYQLTASYLNASISRVRRKDDSGPMRVLAALRGSELFEALPQLVRPGLTIQYYDSVADALAAVKTGCADAVYLCTRSAELAVYEDIRSSLVAEFVSDLYADYAVAVRHSEDTQLASIINKAAISITDGEIAAAVARNTGHPKRDFSLLGFFYANALLTVMVLLALLLTVTIFLGALMVYRRRDFRMAALIKTLPVRFFVIDRAGNLRYSAVGGMADEWRNRVMNTLDDLPDDGVNKLMREVVARVLDTGREEVVDFRYKDGWRSARVSPLPHRLFNADTAVWISQDTSLLQTAKFEAQAADRAKSYFLATMSHEIRTPLNAVIGYAELLRIGDGSEEERRECLEGISFAGNALLVLINDILELSRLEAGSLPIVPVMADPTLLLERSVAVFAAKAREKKLELICAIAPGMPERIYVDDGRLRQVLLNLLGNAVKFTERGTVRLRARFIADGATAGTLILEVIDSGIGISEAFLTRMFQPFSQQESAHGRRKYEGTGLGLTISRRLIENMRGTLEVSSCEGRGSTFTVTLTGVRCQRGGATAAAIATET